MPLQTVVAAHHIKSLSVDVHIVFLILPCFLASMFVGYQSLHTTAYNVNNISVAKHGIIGATSRYYGMIFPIASRYNVILQCTPCFLIMPHQKSLRR
jgi:hypothetical protein